MGLINWGYLKDKAILGGFFLFFFALFLAMGFGNAFVSLNWGTDIPELNTSGVPNGSEVQDPFTGFSQNVTVEGIAENGSVELQSENTTRAYPLLGVSIVTNEQPNQILPQKDSRRGCYARTIDETTSFMNSFNGSEEFSTVPLVERNSTDNTVKIKSMVVLNSTDNRLGVRFVERGLGVVTNKSVIDKFREENDSISPVVQAQKEAASNDVGIWKCDGMDSYKQTWNYGE